MKKFFSDFLYCIIAIILSLFMTIITLIIGALTFMVVVIICTSLFIYYATTDIVKRFIKEIKTICWAVKEIVKKMGNALEEFYNSFKD